MESRVLEYVGGSQTGRIGKLCGYHVNYVMGTASEMTCGVQGGARA